MLHDLSIYKYMLHLTL
uniref:Uncharacterized protein n=1 Tax=Arundo donax TaxID=35708 RepID=A0A0A9B4Y6_ARUDO